MATVPLPENPHQPYHYRRIHSNSITAGLIQSQHHRKIDSHSLTTGPTTTKQDSHGTITGGPMATVPLPENQQQQYQSRINTVTASPEDR